MHVNLNTNINLTRPNFKAKFSNDRQTVGILKKLANKKPIETILSIDLLKNAGTNDIISLRSFETGSIRGIKIINETISQECPIHSSVESNYRDFFDGIQRVLLSNKTYPESAISKIKKVEDFTEQKIVQKQIELKNLQNELKRLETEKLENDTKLAIKYIDSNV